MKNQENNDIWNIKFDPKRKVIIYDCQKDLLGKDDSALKELYENIMEITTNMNMPAEVELYDVKMQITPGMTWEQVLETCKTASESQKEKNENKKEFMAEHKERLEQSKKMTNEIRLGILNSEHPKPMEIDESHEGIDMNIVTSHAFQNYVKENNEEFSSILENLKKSAKIIALKNRIEESKRSSFSLYVRSTEDFIAEDKGRDYDSVWPRTLGIVSDEIYRRHKAEIESIVGKENYAFLKKLEQENDYVVNITISEIRPGSDGSFYSTTYAEARECFCGQRKVAFENELCTATVKEGDKILLTTKDVEDPKFGTLRKRDAFVYKDGKYTHFYQSYSSLSDIRTNVVHLTKSMQQKSQGAVKHDGAGRTI